MEGAPAKRSKILPANAYTKLKPGEAYRPIVPASDGRAEVTRWSVVLGSLMVILWSSACIYIALKAGSGLEASIPIAVMAIFFGKLRQIRSTILENVMVQSIGQASGVVAAGAAFVIPALYINQLQPTWWHIFLACTVGGFLGVVLIIPIRAYFVRDLHGELPFPEATAVNEILCSGESSGKSAGKILLMSIGLGAVYDFLVETFHTWNPMMSTSTLMGGWGQKLADMRIELKMNGLAALFGLGYIIGLRYAAIIAAGSVLAYVVMVPMIYLFGAHIDSFSYAGQTYTIAKMSAGDIFSAFVKPIGIGAIAVSGLIGMIRLGKIIVGSVLLGFKGLLKKEGDAAPRTERTNIDMNPKTVLLIQLVCMVAMGVLFYIVSASKGGFGVGQSALYAVVGMLVGFVISFLFTPVAAQAIAIVGVNPVSGMTLITLIIAAAVMATVGLSGTAGMFIALVIGTAVCTALSTSGALISDFKIGYWIGSTPRNQQIWKFLGIVLAALTVAFIIPVMDHSYHFLVEGPGGALVSNTEVLPAPQANMLAAIIKGLMSQSEQPVLLYSLGGLIAIMLYMAGVPMLAFALGMYLPISITLAQLAGGFTAWLVSRSGKTEEIKNTRREQGTLIASGIMAGAAIIGIASAVMRLPEVGAPIRSLSVGVSFFYETTDAGNRLIKHEAPGTAFALWGGGNQELVAAGRKGQIYRYSGDRWVTEATGASSHLFALWGSNPQNLYAAGEGGAVLHFNGQRWQPMATGVQQTLTALWGSGPRELFAVGRGGTVVRYDGRAWTRMQTGTTENLLAVWGNGPQDVYAVGKKGTLIHFDGQRWQPMASGVEAHLTAVWSPGAGDAFAAGDGGTVLRYDGQQWQAQDTGLRGRIVSVWGNGPREVFAASQDGAMAQFDGQRWQNKTPGADLGLMAVWAQGPSRAFGAAGDGALYHYDGNQWTVIRSHWYHGFPGQMISLVMFLLLAAACYLLARKGAAWELADSTARELREATAEADKHAEAQQGGAYRDKQTAAQARLNAAEKEVVEARRHLDSVAGDAEPGAKDKDSD